MGLFDKLFKKADIQEFDYAPQSEQEAWIGILLLSMLADGKISKKENKAFIEKLIPEPFFRDHDIIELYKRVADYYLESDMEEEQFLSVWCKHVSEENKEKLFRLVLSMSFADKFNQEEKVVAEKIANELGFSQEELTRIFTDFLGVK